MAHLNEDNQDEKWTTRHRRRYIVRDTGHHHGPSPNPKLQSLKQHRIRRIQPKNVSQRTPSSVNFCRLSPRSGLPVLDTTHPALNTTRKAACFAGRNASNHHILEIKEFGARKLVEFHW